MTPWNSSKYGLFSSFYVPIKNFVLHPAARAVVFVLAGSEADMVIFTGLVAANRDLITF